MNKSKNIIPEQAKSKVDYTNNNNLAGLILNKTRLLEKLQQCMSLRDLKKLKSNIINLRDIILHPKEDNEGLLNIDTDGDTVVFKRDPFLKQLNQMIDSFTEKRVKYYLKRLADGLEKIKTNRINDINLLRWKEYNEIITDSLWVLDKRDTSGAHLGSYWGNFIPQIPHQMILRYTKLGEWILDPFLGSGTTLIECNRLGRNGIGVELYEKVCQKANELISKEPNPFAVKTQVEVGDSRAFNFSEILAKIGVKNVQLIIMHPPYYDIIKFGNNPNDLSNSKKLEQFLQNFEQVVKNVTQILEKNRFLVLVIGDKYNKGEWIPLGFKCMEKVVNNGYKLKSIIVKNFEQTRGKRNQEELWKYRALAGGFYIFKHEYVMLFKKERS